MKWMRKRDRGGGGEAQRAIEQATQSMRIAESRREVVADLTEKLVIQGQRNNFIERLNMHVNRGGAG